jgi:hypothetical protein
LLKKKSFFCNAMNSTNRPPTPLWVKVSGIALIVLVLGFLLLHFTGHGFHHHR